MKFSLILSTKGRTEEIARVFDGFRSQTLQDFEVIISDQNEDDRVLDLLGKINWPGQLIHIRSSGGLSGGRNAALPLAKGELIGFPDDDCMYLPALLEDVARFFDGHPQVGLLSGRSVADDGGDAVSAHSKTAGEIQPLTIYLQCIEFALFVRRVAIGDVRFDGNMGVGCPTPWQADEGPDFILQLRDRGVKCYYDPAFAVWHPRITLNYGPAMRDRCYRYSCGSGYFLRKHRFPFWFFLKLNLRTLAGVVLGLLTFNFDRARFYGARLRGRWRGWTGYDPIVGS